MQQFLSFYEAKIAIVVHDKNIFIGKGHFSLVPKTMITLRARVTFALFLADRFSSLRQNEPGRYIFLRRL